MAINPLPRNIAVVRLDALGDTILTIPLLDSLRKLVPGARIVVIASPRGYPALKDSHSVDEVLVIEPGELTWTRMRTVAGQLRERNIALSINVTEKLGGYLIPFMAPVPARIGFNPGFIQPVKECICQALLTHKIHYMNDPSRPGGEHEIERQHRLLEPLGGEGSPGPYRIAIDEEHGKWAREFLGAACGGAAVPVALHLSNKWLDDGGSDDFLRILAGELQKMSHLVLTYGPAEKAWAEPFAASLGQERLTVFHDPSYLRWASVLSLTKALVTMDTSAGHVAAGVSLPVVDVFPSLYFAHCTERWHPWRVAHRLVEKKSLQEVSGREKEERQEELLAHIMKALQELLQCQNS
ncbi:MAG: glycosyltransferase family 9 protein [Candidatus Eremiobacteraeota bacterium]|nr:glycosyltransferase family 9 protein [Candidatus Eremiobacteraeota bacterium]